MIDVNVETDKINQKLGKLEKKFAQLIKTSEKASKMTSEKHQKLQNEVITTSFLFLRSYVISTTNIREQGTINKYNIYMKHLQHIYTTHVHLSENILRLQIMSLFDHFRLCALCCSFWFAFCYLIRSPTQKKWWKDLGTALKNWRLCVMASKTRH